MEREAEAKDNLWRARLDAVLMHRIWGSLIFLGIVYIIFFLSFAIGDPLVRLIQTGTQLFSVWACRMLEPWPRLQSLLGEGVVGGVGGVLAFLPNVVLLFGAITVLENSGYMMRVSRLMSRIMKIMGLNGSSFAPLLLGFGCSVPAILSTRRIETRSDRLVTIAVLPMMSCAGRLPIYMMFVSALFPSRLQAPVLFGIYASGVLLALCCARLLKNTLFKAPQRDSLHHMKRLRLPPPAEGGHPDVVTGFHVRPESRHFHSWGLHHPVVSEHLPQAGRKHGADKRSGHGTFLRRTNRPLDGTRHASGRI